MAVEYQPLQPHHYDPGEYAKHQQQKENERQKMPPKKEEPSEKSPLLEKHSVSNKPVESEKTGDFATKIYDIGQSIKKFFTGETTSSHSYTQIKDDDVEIELQEIPDKREIPDFEVQQAHENAQPQAKESLLSKIKSVFNNCLPDKTKQQKPEPQVAQQNWFQIQASKVQSYFSPEEKFKKLKLKEIELNNKIKILEPLIKENEQLKLDIKNINEKIKEIIDKKNKANDYVDKEGRKKSAKLHLKLDEQLAPLRKELSKLEDILKENSLKLSSTGIINDLKQELSEVEKQLDAIKAKQEKLAEIALIKQQNNVAELKTKVSERLSKFDLDKIKIESNISLFKTNQQNLNLINSKLDDNYLLLGKHSGNKLPFALLDEKGNLIPELKIDGSPQTEKAKKDKGKYLSKEYLTENGLKILVPPDKYGNIPIYKKTQDGKIVRDLKKKLSELNTNPITADKKEKAKILFEAALKEIQQNLVDYENLTNDTMRIAINKFKGKISKFGKLKNFIFNHAKRDHIASNASHNIKQLKIKFSMPDDLRKLYDKLSEDYEKLSNESGQEIYLKKLKKDLILLGILEKAEKQMIEYGEKIAKDFPDLL